MSSPGDSRERGYEAARATMVERQLRRRGIRDPRVLEAMGEVPRERFVPLARRSRAYADAALSIGCEQTISQPWIVAAICEALELSGDERVLEVGTGSGYSAAILARLAREVLTIERVPELAERARLTLRELRALNVEIRVGDGSRGAPDRAPYDAIAVHAAAPEPPASLLGQLAPAGILVVPVAERRAEVLTAFRSIAGRIERHAIAPCRFVPLIGEEGYPEA